jgi:hypothetical protein
MVSMADLVIEHEQNYGHRWANVTVYYGPRIQTWQPYPLAFYPSALHTITLK